MKKNKCVMIFSDKSSGSSILQKELLKAEDINVVRYTKHYERETLYWNKAVAILNLPQAQISYSQIPIQKNIAEHDMRYFFQRNLPGWKVKELTKRSLFEGWERLCDEYGPVFMEKSPHHLHCRSSLKLIQELVACSNTDFYFIGLIRNPMDTLYSSWKRWGADPDKTQYDWYRAYQNLLEFKKIIGERLLIVNYEQMVSATTVATKICDFLNLTIDNEFSKGFHQRSIHKWKLDKMYGFCLANEVYKLASLFGYSDDSLDNKSNALWRFFKPALILCNNFMNFFRRHL